MTGWLPPFPQDGPIFCPLRHSGNMQPVEVRVVPIPGVILSLLAMGTIIGTELIIQGVIFRRPEMLASTAQTPGVFMICTAMCVNG